MQPDKLADDAPYPEDGSGDSSVEGELCPTEAGGTGSATRAVTTLSSLSGAGDLLYAEYSASQPVRSTQPVR